jgi:hypothetical protein
VPAQAAAAPPPELARCHLDATAVHHGHLAHHRAVLVQRVDAQVVVRDHHEAGGEAARPGIEQRQAGHERLAAAVAAAQELDGALAAAGQVELPVPLAALLVDAHRKGVDAALRDQPFAQALEDMLDISPGQGAHERLPSRTYRFAPATTSMRTPKGALPAKSSKCIEKRRSARSLPTILAASVAVTTPWASRCHPFS